MEILPYGPSFTVYVGLYLEHIEHASKEEKAHTQSPFDLPSSWLHKSTLFPVWYISLLDSILHFQEEVSLWWTSPSLAEHGLVREPHSTACCVSFSTVVIFMIALVYLPECWCYSWLLALLSHLLPAHNAHLQFNVPWLPGRYDQREPCRRGEWERKVRLGYLSSVLPW